MRPKLKLAAATLLGLVATSAIAESVGVVKRSHGEVTIERSGAQIAATPGTEILRGDRLATGADGHATIAMYTTAPVSVGPNTDIPVARYAGEQQPVPKKRIPAILEGIASFLAINRQR
jgi:hypothetical protein